MVSADADLATPSQPGAPRDTLPKKGRPRTRSSKDMPPDSGNFRSTVTAKRKSKASRQPPEEFTDSDGRGSPSLPPSPSPAPPTRPRVRRASKRQQIVSSGSNFGEERGSPGADPTQRSSPPRRSEQARTITSEAAAVDRDDPEAGALPCLDLFRRRLNRWIHCNRWIYTQSAITISHQSDDRTRERHLRRDTIERHPERG